MRERAIVSNAMRKVKRLEFEEAARQIRSNFEKLHEEFEAIIRIAEIELPIPKGYLPHPKVISEALISLVKKGELEVYLTDEGTLVYELLPGKYIA